MAIPKRIPVSRKGGNYSSCMGLYSLDLEDNQFWGRGSVAFLAPMPQSESTYTRPNKQWYAVLHKFDGWGKHIGTEYWCAGASGDGEKEVCERARAKLDEMVAALGEVESADIEIELFQVEIDGDLFGMVDVSQPEAGKAFADRVAMIPGDLLFHAPWDGNYDT